DLLGAGLAHVGEDVALVVRLDRLERLVGVDVLSADHVRDTYPLALELLEPRLELGALRGSRGVRLDRLVLRRRRGEDSGSAHGGDCRVERGAGGADAVRGSGLGGGRALDGRGR